MPNRDRRQSDWTIGPAGWAPVLVLTLLALIGSLSAVSAPWSATAAGPDARPIAEARINVNTASEARLQLLPRIGPTLARRLIDDRDANGPFEDAEDIQRVKGIGPQTARRIAAIADFSIPNQDGR